jgi:hypothetical protein
MTPLEKLEAFSAWDLEPALAEEELETLLSSAAKADAAGRNPQHEEWAPTYDMNAAAAAAWLLKAGRAFSAVETDPETLAAASRVFDNCMRMAAAYGSKRSATANFTP